MGSSDKDKNCKGDNMKRTNIQRNSSLENMDSMEYVRFLESKGYRREQLHIDETSEIVTTQSLAEGCVGTVTSIRCPSRYKISILGRNQLNQLPQLPGDISPGSTILHMLSLRLADLNGCEISPYCRIRIVKETPSLAIVLCETMLYKDITKTEYSKIPPNRMKCDENLYRFNDHIQLNGEDRLKIDVVQPDIGIDSSNIKLYLDIDLWEEP